MAIDDSIDCAFGNSMSLYIKYPLVLFGIRESFDWAVRGIIYYILVKRNNIKKKEKWSIKHEKHNK